MSSSRSSTLSLLLAASALGLAGYAIYQGGATQQDLAGQLAQIEVQAAQLQEENQALGDQLAQAAQALEEQNQSLATIPSIAQLSELQELTDVLGERILEIESSTAGSFTQRVRTAVLDDPTMLFEAVDAYEQQQIAAQASLYQDELTRDAYLPVLGNPDGDITLVEYFDYNCGYCRRAMEDVLALVADDGNIRLVLKEFPVLSVESQEAALVSMAAADQVDYLTLHRTAMSTPGQVNADLMLSIAEELGADMDALQAELSDDQCSLISALLRTNEVAQALGITGTPAFYIEGTLIPGAVGRGELEAVIADIRAARDEQS